MTKKRIEILGEELEDLDFSQVGSPEFATAYQHAVASAGYENRNRWVTKTRRGIGFHIRIEIPAWARAVVNEIQATDESNQNRIA